MPDLFEEAVTAEDFALPGDADRVARARAAAEQPADPAEHVEAPAAVAETPAEPSTEPEASETTETQEPEEPTKEEILAQKYKSEDDLRRAHLELQELAGRQMQEVGELRKVVRELSDRVSQPAPVDVTQDLIETNPAYAAQMAYDQGNGAAFQAAFEAWKEFDPTTAAVWAAGKQAEERIAAMQSAYDERIAGLEKSLAPVSQESQANEAARLAAARADQLPGLGEFITNTQAVAQMANEFPDEAQAILSGSPDQKVRAFEKLFLIHRGRESDTHRATQEQVARETAQAAQQAREDAFVASATHTSSERKLSEAEQMYAEWDAMEAPFRDGWNI